MKGCIGTGRIRTMECTCVLWLVGMLLFGSSVGAVNSLIMTGPTNERDHRTNVGLVDEADDELEDYYNNQGQLCERFTQGRRAADMVMLLQSRSPQHFIIAAHGTPSTLIVGNNVVAETINAVDIQNNVHNGGKQMGRIANSPLPFSAGLFFTEDSRFLTGARDLAEVFMGTFGCWFFVGCDRPSAANKKLFCDDYADQVTDRRSSYIQAYRFAQGQTSDTTQWDCACLGQGAGVRHQTWDDRYRSIARTEAWEGLVINKGVPMQLTYDRNNYNFISNGAYVVFHGVIDNNVLDPDPGTLEVTVERWDQNQANWVTVSVTNFNIRNRDYTFGGITARGGTDTCSVFIDGWIMSNQGNNDVRITAIFNSVNAQVIRVDRYEFMEIGG